MTTIAINGQTSKYYSENDVTYTVVKVPTQSKEMNNGIKYRRLFLLRINSEKTIAVPLHHNLSFLFSGNCITHRQHCDKECGLDGSIFYNMVSYGNKRLYSHNRQSFLRNENNKVVN